MLLLIRFELEKMLNHELPSPQTCDGPEASEKMHDKTRLGDLSCGGVPSTVSSEIGRFVFKRGFLSPFGVTRVQRNPSVHCLSEWISKMKHRL